MKTSVALITAGIVGAVLFTYHFMLLALVGFWIAFKKA